MHVHYFPQYSVLLVPISKHRRVAPLVFSASVLHRKLLPVRVIQTIRDSLGARLLISQMINAAAVDRPGQFHSLTVLHVVVVVQHKVFDRHRHLSWQLSLIGRAALG